MRKLGSVARSGCSSCGSPGRWVLAATTPRRDGEDARLPGGESPLQAEDDHHPQGGQIKWVNATSSCHHTSTSARRVGLGGPGPGGSFGHKFAKTGSFTTTDVPRALRDDRHDCREALDSGLLRFGHLRAPPVHRLALAPWEC